MLNSFPVALLAGSILGLFSGLGIGGGSLLILWLTLVLDVPSEEAKAINLLFFLPSALLSSFFRYKSGQLPFQKILPAMLAGSITAVIFSDWSAHWQTQLLQKLLGALLLVTGIRELRYRPEKN